MAKFDDKELLKILKLDKKMLDRFKQIQKETIEEAKRLSSIKNKKIKVLEIGRAHV